ncbi:MAG TPA: hypothetical protein VG079_06635 [Gaiellaceae bacterium]|nr:hypothetical protein [Gaiellaceae bacterium]
MFLPVLVLGLIGAGFGAVTFGGPSAPEDASALASPKPLKKPAPAKTSRVRGSSASAPVKAPTPLERELRAHRAVVVVFYAPGASLDALTTREARAGAQAAGAGFLAVDASKESAVAALAKEHDLRAAPGILVVTRGPKVAVRFDSFEDRETIAQAAVNAAA